LFAISFFFTLGAKTRVPAAAGLVMLIMNVNRKFIPAVIVVLASLALTGTTRQQYEPGSWCCLCMCHSVDEHKCARLCIKMQQGKKIIEEPQMKECTNSCLRHGVKQIFPQEEYK